MACSLNDCGFYVFLGFLAAIAVFLIFYVILYVYTAYITYRYHSLDLIRQKEQDLERLEKRYQSMKL